MAANREVQKVIAFPAVCLNAPTNYFSLVFMLPNYPDLCYIFMPRMRISGPTGYVVCAGCNQHRNSSTTPVLLRASDGVSLRDDPTRGHLLQCNPRKYAESMQFYSPFDDAPTIPRYAFKGEKMRLTEYSNVLYRIGEDQLKCLKFAVKRNRFDVVTVNCEGCKFVHNILECNEELTNYCVSNGYFDKDPTKKHHPLCRNFDYAETMAAHDRAWRRPVGPILEFRGELQRIPTKRVVYIYRLPNDKSQCFVFLKRLASSNIVYCVGCNRKQDYLNDVTPREIDGSSIKEDPCLNHCEECTSMNYATSVNGHIFIAEPTNAQPPKYEFALGRAIVTAMDNVLYKVDENRCYRFDAKRKHRDNLFLHCSTCSLLYQEKFTKPAGDFDIPHYNFRFNRFHENPNKMHLEGCAPLQYSAAKAHQYRLYKETEKLLLNSVQQVQTAPQPTIESPPAKRPRLSVTRKPNLITSELREKMRKKLCKSLENDDAEAAEVQTSHKSTENTGDVPPQVENEQSDTKGNFFQDMPGNDNIDPQADIHAIASQREVHALAEAAQVENEQSDRTDHCSKDMPEDDNIEPPVEMPAIESQPEVHASAEATQDENEPSDTMDQDSQDISEDNIEPLADMHAMEPQPDVQAPTDREAAQVQNEQSDTIDQYSQDIAEDNIEPLAEIPAIEIPAPVEVVPQDEAPIVLTARRVITAPDVVKKVLTVRSACFERSFPAHFFVSSDLTAKMFDRTLTLELEQNGDLNGNGEAFTRYRVRIPEDVDIDNIKISIEDQHVIVSAPFIQ